MFKITGDKKKDQEIIKKRKIDHIEICLSENVNSHYNYWDDVHLIHKALPEINKKNIFTKIKFLGKELNCPILIAAMSGGHSKSKLLNENFAKVASELGIGLCLGSQRSMLENNDFLKSYSIVRRYDVPLVMANIGATQLIKQKNRLPFKIAQVQKAMDTINADVLTIFLNLPQELIQPEGDNNSLGILKTIKKLSKSFLINVKECGFGISKEVALLLKEAGVKSIEVSGVSGTSWAAVESYRARKINDINKENLGKLLWNWGIPSPISVQECRHADKNLKIIGSGGIRNGLDIAKAIALGADVSSLARELLPHAMKSSDSLLNKIKNIIKELKTIMLLTGAKEIEELKKVKYVLTGKTYEWKQQRIK